MVLSSLNPTFWTSGPTRALESEIKFEGNVSQINIYCLQEAHFFHDASKAFS